MARIALISPGDVTGRVREIFRVKFHSTSLRAEGGTDEQVDLHHRYVCRAA